MTRIYRKPSVQFKRIDFQPAASFPIDDRTIFLLGETQKGEDNPVKVKSYEDFVAHFGAGNNARTKAFAKQVKDLFDLNPKDVWIIKVTQSGEALTADELGSALDTIRVDLGIGMVLCPMATTKALVAKIAEHCYNNNRVAIVDVPTTATDKGAKKTYAQSVSSIAHADKVMLVGDALTRGEDETLPASIATAVQTTKIQAIYNIQPIAQQVSVVGGGWTGGTYTDEDAREMYEAGVMLVSKTPIGTVLEGYMSLADRNNIWADFAGSRLFMLLEARANLLGYGFIGSPITSETITSFHGALSNLLAEIHAQGGLYGSADEAFLVNTADVNDAETASKRLLNAQIGIRVAEHVEVVITTALRVPVTEQIPAKF